MSVYTGAAMHRAATKFPPCAIAFAALIMTACTHTIVAPPTPSRPATTFLLDHGRHASLVLPHEDGITRYAYGHWGYYALNRTGTLRASGTLFGANQAGLGRKRLPGPPTLSAVQEQVRVPIEAAWRIDVSHERAAELVARLDAIFQERANTLTPNPLYDLEFVHHPTPYSVGHNSNHATGEWLRALGCRVRMAGPFSSWDVEGAITQSARTKNPP